MKYNTFSIISFSQLYIFILHSPIILLLYYNLCSKVNSFQRLHIYLICVWNNYSFEIKYLIWRKRKWGVRSFFVSSLFQWKVETCVMLYCYCVVLSLWGKCGFWFKFDTGQFVIVASTTQCVIIMVKLIYQYSVYFQSNTLVRVDQWY